MSPIGPNQERVLYPARRSPFKGRGILRGVPDFIMLVSLAALLPPLARPSHCALEALRKSVSGETMTTPGGAGTYPMRKRSFLRARRTGFYHRVGVPHHTGLRPFAALPRPDALSPLPCAVVSTYTST
jgi:hypothetical protein